VQELVVSGAGVELTEAVPPPFGQFGSCSLVVHAAAVYDEVIVGVAEQPSVTHDEVNVLQSVEVVMPAGQDVKIL
jgi:hypothetical protein